MPRFEGCVEAREISLTRKGANQHAHVLVRKNLDGGAPDRQQPENTEMTTEAEKAAAAARTTEINKAAMAITNKVLAMNDVTKAFYLGLGEDKQEAFLAKSAADQTVEAETAKAAVDRAAAEAEAAKAGKTAAEVETQKALDTANARIADLEKRDQERTQDAEIEKTASTADFKGFPGGPTAVVTALKSVRGLSEDVRKSFEAGLKAQAEVARSSGLTLGARTDADVSKREGAQKRIDDAIEKRAAEKKISKAMAYNEVVVLKEHEADVAIINGKSDE